MKYGAWTLISMPYSAASLPISLAVFSLRRTPFPKEYSNSSKPSDDTHFGISMVAEWSSKKLSECPEGPNFGALVRLISII